MVRDSEAMASPKGKRKRSDVDEIYPNSLVTAMGGPSSGKAGLARDQTEINRIIAEASQHSKFFQEARRKDAQLTERIQRLIKQRDEIMKAVDIPKAEAHVDQMIAELEASRDLSRVICHFDLDAFYCSVEALDDPTLIGKPFGVSGGVLSTASYEARKYGCRSGMATFVAKKLCPELIVLPSRFARYSEKSKEVMNVLAKYDPDMSIMGADEAYLTLNDYCDTHNMTPEDCVKQIREEVERETQLTCSAGIAANKMLAKICSDRNKPNGQFSLPRESTAIIEFMSELPIRKIPGIGRVSERVLSELGVKTCGDVNRHRAMISAMDKQLGLRSLLQAYLGLGSNVVEPPAREWRKSVGVETTFHALGDKEQLLAKLDRLAGDLEEDLARTGWAGRTLTVKYKLDTFQTYTRAKTLSRYITSKQDILAAGRELFIRELPLKLRLLGLRLSTLKDLRTPTGGIEKFFDKANSTPSPSKKRKRNRDSDGDFVIMESFSLQGDEDSDEEEDDRAHWDAEIPGMPSRWGKVALPPKEKPPDQYLGKKPSSTTSAPNEGASLSSVLNKGADPDSALAGPSFVPLLVEPKISPTKPRSTSAAEDGDEVGASANFQTCPICSKELRVDNAGLNAHVDYCLSRETIKEAAKTKIQDAGSKSKVPQLHWPLRDKKAPEKR